MDQSICGDLTVKQVLDAHAETIPVFIELRTFCVGCPMERFCTLEEVAAAYKIPSDLLLEKLRTSIQIPIEEYCMKPFKFGILILILTAVLIACAPQAGVVNTEYVLTTAMRDGNFVYLGVDGEINGVVNPALHAKPGERITVMLVNSGEGTHDIVFEDLQVHSDKITKKGETTSITFTVPDKEVAVEYYDTTH